MIPANADTQTANREVTTEIQQQIALAVDGLIDSLPSPERLSAEQRRGIIARYTAVLEGNFIYWMTGALLAVQSSEARAIILENLHDEVRDCHPGMLRRFAIAARSIPTDVDSIAVSRDLTNVRLFIGRLSAVHTVVTMAFFEGFIQKFMAFLAELAAAQGSSEFEYTDVHGICDVAHSQELFHALDAEMAADPIELNAGLFEGVGLLSALIQSIVHGARSQAEQAA
ncbi:MAG TPA: iron-containing redox enzyme family protein [Terriglobales bacterium]|nr:iron-containing redox enzyme family protein [Terriglobales bacterium]